MDPKYTETQQQRQAREQNFKCHAPVNAPLDNQTDRYTAIRDKAGEFARFLNEQVPPSRELSSVMTNLEQAVFWANAGIARNEYRPD